MSQRQVAEAIKLRDIALQGGPGECVSLKQCREYCSVPDNFEECINFSREAGVITLQEVERINDFIEKGGPGGCRTKKECDEYCGGAENFRECLDFMVENNYLSEENIDEIEDKIKKAEESVEEQLEQFKKNFDLENIEEEEIKRQIQEKLQPYKDILNTVN